MKADMYGTPTEQKRFELGWRQPAQRPMCGNCRHGEEVILNPDSLYEHARFHCRKGGFATLKQALCNGWEGKP